MRKKTHLSIRGLPGWSGSRSAVLAAAAFQLVSLISVASAQARQEEWTHFGSLTCTMGPSIGSALGAWQQARCVFASNRTKMTKRYMGRITQTGLDTGAAAGRKLLWKVFVKAPGSSLPEIGGTYQAAPADKAMAAGIGLDVLTNARRPVFLQPVSVEGDWSGNLAFVVATLRLE